MKSTLQINEPQIQKLLSLIDDSKIPALPLQFDHLPVQLLSKEFTKLNHTHPYRIHYLGPRPLHTLTLHRRYGHQEQQYLSHKGQQDSSQRSYPVPLRRIVNSNYMNERLRDNHHYRFSFFYRAFEGMNPTISPEQLSFNSAFQSGNLDCAIRVSHSEYDLFLRIDSNSRGHTNWYYFSIKNKKHIDSSIKLNICNLIKRPGLYDQGLRPFVKSSKKYQMNGEQWEQKGENVQLEEMPLRYELLGNKANNFFRLSFSYTFEYEQDEVFFAYCIPYTYSDLHSDVQSWQKSQSVKKVSLGRSLSGLELPLLHIANHQTRGNSGLLKKNIVITARAHPAETSGSYVLRGFLKWILSQTHQAVELRQKVNIFIIPMLNPDGVVLGNSRTSAAGKDLNRQFLQVKKDLYPEVYLTKTLIARLQKKFGVLLFLDFHGHSKKKNTFFYGPAYPISHREYYKCRAFPRLIEKINGSFRFYSCSFQISEAKRSTARAVALTQLKVPYAYTVQSSVGLYYNPNLMKTFNYSISQWEEMGANIALGLSQFVFGIEEFQTISKQRKNQRERIRQDKIKQKELDNQKRQKKKSLFFDVMEQVKISASAFKENFDEDMQSDDHDSKQDLQPYMQAQFNNLVIIGRQQQRKSNNKKIPQEEEQNFQITEQDKQELEQVRFIEQIPKMAPQKVSRSVDSRVSCPKILPISQKNKRQNKTLEVSKVGRYSLQPKEPQNFIRVNKQRYSTGNFNFFAEDRCQIVAFPKNPLRKRDLDIQFDKNAHESTTKSNIRTIIDRLSLGKIKSSIIDISSYQSFNCLQLDNRAMTIKTLKRK